MGFARMTFSTRASLHACLIYIDLYMYTHTRARARAQLARSQLQKKEDRTVRQTPCAHVPLFTSIYSRHSSEALRQDRPCLVSRLLFACKFILAVFIINLSSSNCIALAARFIPNAVWRDATRVAPREGQRRERRREGRRIDTGRRSAHRRRGEPEPERPRVEPRRRVSILISVTNVERSRASRGARTISTICGWFWAQDPSLHRDRMQRYGGTRFLIVI